VRVARTSKDESKRPGRPRKYGRPARLLAVTLPQEVIGALKQLHADPGWAIVSLVENVAPRNGAERLPPVQLVQVGQGQSLIVVNSAVIAALPEIRTIPLTDGTAFLAFEPGRGLADLEVVVRDRLERRRLRQRDRDVLEELKLQLRRWRTDGKLQFESRTIVLVSAARVSSKKSGEVTENR
jgi:hypothetical protein